MKDPGKVVVVMVFVVVLGWMRNRRWLTGLVVSLVIFLGVGVFVSARAATEDKNLSKARAVKISPHPGSLEGKTVLLRWNGKYNGDKFLNRVGELLTQQVKKVKVVKMWEVDSGTAVISKSAEVSSQVTEKIAKLKPDIVIAAQAD